MLLATLSVFFFELFEEALEEFIAYGLAELIAKAIAAASAIALTTVAKVVLKMTIKKFTYRKGADKMNYLKTFFSNIGTAFKTNPVVLTSTGVISFPGFGLIGVGLIAIFNHFGVALPDWAVYVISGVVAALIVSLADWGIISAGWETEAQKALRLTNKANAKAEAQIEAEAQARIKAEAKENAKLAKAAQAKLVADQKAEAEKEAQEAYEKKLNAKVAELKLAQLIKK